MRQYIEQNDISVRLHESKCGADIVNISVKIGQTWTKYGLMMLINQLENIIEEMKEL